MEREQNTLVVAAWCAVCDLLPVGQRRKDLRGRDQDAGHQGHDRGLEARPVLLVESARRREHEQRHAEIEGELERARERQQGEDYRREQMRDPAAARNGELEKQKDERRPRTGGQDHRLAALAEHESRVGITERTEQCAEAPDADRLQVRVRGQLGQHEVTDHVQSVGSDRRAEEQQQPRRVQNRKGGIGEQRMTHPEIGRPRNLPGDEHASGVKELWQPLSRVAAALEHAESDLLPRKNHERRDQRHQRDRGFSGVWARRDRSIAWRVVIGTRQCVRTIEPRPAPGRETERLWAARLPAFRRHRARP